MVEFNVRFTRPVPVPDDDEGTEVVVSGVVKEVTEDGLTRLDLTATCHGEKVLVAWPGRRSASGRAGLGNSAAYPYTGAPWGSDPCLRRVRSGG